jgi:hypothetical protein
MNFLKRRVSATVWELLILLVVVIAFATVYRLYFSRAVALTQVCERIETIMNDEVADLFNKLSEDGSLALKDVNRLCQIRRPIKEATPPQ